VRLRVIDMTQGNAILAGEAALLRAAMEHIVENAIDFSPPGSEICVRITAGRSLAVLAIEDEGPGAAPEVLPQIFNRYFSDRSAVPSVVPHDTKGAEDTPNFGLGLWIARRNVEALRGRIFAENRRSGGLRLTISLPIVQLSDR
jgi:two-component system sensor histidine kinase ChvG